MFTKRRLQNVERRGVNSEATSKISRHIGSGKSEMYRSGLIVWCALLLVAAYAMENPGRSSREWEDIAQFDPYVNFITTLNHDENSKRDDEISVQHGYRSNYIKNFQEKGDLDNTPAELRDNSMKIDDESNSLMLQELYPENNSNENNLNKTHNNIVYAPICCEFGYRMAMNYICTPDDRVYPFSMVYGTNKRMNEFFQLIVSNPCEEEGGMRLRFDPELDESYIYKVLTNGSILLLTYNNVLVDPWSYCFAVMSKDEYQLIVCHFQINKNLTEDIYEDINVKGTSISFTVTLLSLLLTFVLYTILPDFQNLNSYIFRGYIGSLFILYILFAINLVPEGNLLNNCIAFAYSLQFCWSASFFWLNALCFNMWWTFGNVRTETQKDKKKFIMYAIYAWGCASVLCIVCAIMDFVPSVPENFIKPEFGKVMCWFSTDEAKAAYFYGPMSVTIISNICMFIFTAIKNEWRRSNISSDLTNSEQHDNVELITFYVSLIVLMNTNWSMELISWLNNDRSASVWHYSYLMNSYLGLIIFSMFVCTKRIMKQLKQFNYQKCTFLPVSINLPRDDCHDTNV